MKREEVICCFIGLALAAVLIALSVNGVIVLPNGFSPNDLFPGLVKKSSPPPRPETPEEKIDRHLNDLDHASVQAANKQLRRINKFFDQCDKRAPVFAEEVFSWGGKWEYVKGFLNGDDGDGFRRFLLENFEKHVVTGDEVRALVESAVAGYVTEVQGLENEMLVRLRADLADDQTFRGDVKALKTDQTFKDTFQRLEADVLPTVANDLKVTIAREVGLLVGSELAAQVLGKALVTRMTVSGGIFATAANTGLVTFGVGLVAGFVIDYLLDWLLRLAGYDPPREVARQVGQALDRMENRLINGDPNAVANLKRLRQLELDAPSEQLRVQYREQAQRIVRSGALGLRHQFQGLIELQSRLRRQALQKMAQEQ